MRFLKDRECNNGRNHTTQEDCRAKAPINISEGELCGRLILEQCRTLDFSDKYYILMQKMINP